MSTNLHKKSVLFIQPIKIKNNSHLQNNSHFNFYFHKTKKINLLLINKLSNYFYTNKKNILDILFI